MKKCDEIEFPPDFFDPPQTRPDGWRDNPDLRRAVNWFKEFIPETQWIKRREDAARRLYRAAIGRMDAPGEPVAMGKFNTGNAAANIACANGVHNHLDREFRWRIICKGWFCQ